MVNCTFQPKTTRITVKKGGKADKYLNGINSTPKPISKMFGMMPLPTIQEKPKFRDTRKVESNIFYEAKKSQTPNRNSFTRNEKIRMVFDSNTPRKNRFDSYAKLDAPAEGLKHFERWHKKA